MIDYSRFHDTEEEPVMRAELCAAKASNIEGEPEASAGAPDASEPPSSSELGEKA
jgi:hypothetical protein